MSDFSMHLAGLDSPAAVSRRTRFFLCVVLVWGVLLWAMADVLWYRGMRPLEWVQLIMFGLLLFPLVMGSVMCAFGFILEVAGGDPLRLSMLPVQKGANGMEADCARAVKSRTAVILPVFNEDTGMVFERVRVMFESLRDLGREEDFHFFVLSDSNDEEKWISEEAAWMELCRQVGGFGKIFYRKRRLAINKKSGNVADFCRRWGRRYHYMITLDADSLMDGATMAKLVDLMDKHPSVGIIQTAPTLIRGESLFARVAQFVVSFYGRLFCAGLNYWQQGRGMYWGHNAIVRLAPFIEGCDLPTLPGAVPFGGHILSHDFVEAALMQRAGYSVWLAYDIEGSHEEGPPTWIDFIKRDRRWCSGNLQHIWLLFSSQLHWINKVHLFLGVMAYLSSPIWLSYIAVTVLQHYENLRGGPLSHRSLLADSLGLSDPLPVGVAIFLVVLGMLIAPRLLAWLLAGIRGMWSSYGGAVKSALSCVMELVLSSLAAPVHMWMNSKFVFFLALGQPVVWGVQNRESDQGTTWREAWEFHGIQVFAGCALGVFLAWETPELLPWMMPLLCGLVMAVPISVLSSRPLLGSVFRRSGFFLTPEEVHPSKLVLGFQLRTRGLGALAQSHSTRAITHAMIRAVIDPYLNAVHVAMLRRRSGRPPRVHAYLRGLCDKFLCYELSKITRRERMAILQDSESMDYLHRKVWQTPDEGLNEGLRTALREYNLLEPVPGAPLSR